MAKVIEECELRLMQAMMQSDDQVLNELLATELTFTNHLGQLMTKQDDIEAHKCGAIKISSIVPSNQHIKIIGDVAIVTVKVRISGIFSGIQSKGDFRFTRVWQQKESEDWQLIVAHSTLVV